MLYLNLFIYEHYRYLQAPLVNTLLAAGLKLRLHSSFTNYLTEAQEPKAVIAPLGRPLHTFNQDSFKKDDLEVFLSIVAYISINLYPSKVNPLSSVNYSSLPIHDVTTSAPSLAYHVADIDHDQLVNIVRSFFDRYFPCVTTNLPWSTEEPVIVMTHDIDGPFLHSYFSLVRSLVLACKGDKKERSSLLYGVSSLLHKAKDPYNNLQEWPQLLSHLFSSYSSSTYFLSVRPPYSTPFSREVSYRSDDHRFLVLKPLIQNKKIELGYHHPIAKLASTHIVRHKQFLETFYNTSIVGNRSHYWSHIYPDPIPLWRLLANTGFSYDASLNSKSIQLVNGINAPFLPFNDSSTNAERLFTVFPTHIMDAYWHTHINSQEDPGHYLRSLLPPPFLFLDWHVRTLSNLGPWRGYLLSLISLLSIYGDIQPRIVSAHSAYSMWINHVRSCLWNHHT